MSATVEANLTFDTDVLTRRAFAQIVDYGCIFGLQLLFPVASVSLWADVLGRPIPTSPLVLLVILVGFGYNVVTEERWNGQTVGKRLVGIRVRSDRGGRASFQQLLLRNLPALIWTNGLIYLVGLLVIAAGDRQQRIFDQVAGTVVVDAE